MASKSKEKGNRFERDIIKYHRERTKFKAKKVPLSGAAQGFKGDVKIQIGDKEYTGECKKRKSGEGFKVMEEWLSGNDFLFLGRNNRMPFVAMTWETYEELLGKINDN